MEEEKERSGIFFISDIHLRHKNIIKYSPERIEKFGMKDEEDLEAHDKWIIDMILSQTKRGDTLYLVGDVVLANQEESLKVLHQLKSKGLKLHLIKGNHDKSIWHRYNMFETINDIKTITFTKKNYPFLLDDFQCILCHFPILSWFNKGRGSAMVYGHVHHNAPQLENVQDLMFNVGLDAPLSGYNLISLEKLYSEYRNRIDKIKTNHEDLKDTHITPKMYMDILSQDNPLIVR